MAEDLGMTMYQVKDGSRTLQFNGQKLGESTSWRPGSNRWIEFSLYKTENGTYVLSRIGASMIYHTSVCTLVDKYGLHEVDSAMLNRGAIPCEICRPSRSEPLVYPEKYRYWTLTSEEPQAVLDALYKYDDNGARYLTKVAERVLETAADQDPEIDAIYRVEFID